MENIAKQRSEKAACVMTLYRCRQSAGGCGAEPYNISAHHLRAAEMRRGGACQAIERQAEKKTCLPRKINRPHRAGAWRVKQALRAMRRRSACACISGFVSFYSCCRKEITLCLKTSLRLKASSKHKARQAQNWPPYIKHFTLLLKRRETNEEG